MFGVLKTPGYFVHQYEVRLGDLIPMTYVSITMLRLLNTTHRS